MTGGSARSCLQGDLAGGILACGARSEQSTGLRTSRARHRVCLARERDDVPLPRAYEFGG